MSALLSTPNPGRGSGERRRTPLTPVLRPQQRMARLPFVIVLILVFGLGMAGLLMLNTTLQTQAFVASELDQQATELSYTEASLQTQVDTLRSTPNLAQRASTLGMRPNPSPAFLVLPSGKIIGEANRVSGEDEPSLIVKTPAQIKAERDAARAERLAEKRAAEAAAKRAAAKRKAEAEKKAAAKKKAEEQKKKEAAAKNDADGTKSTDTSDAKTTDEKTTDEKTTDEKTTDKKSDGQDAGRTTSDQGGR